ncbi:glutathione S-transferase family protein [Dokdonella sp. MW10]|uniref:glutathione S-transferase family protein n=1 Tax=Dokdonella sp. MW10 TaxID=2992926 RepID=UPI003F81538B
MLTLHGSPGWGSAIVEAQLVAYGLPFRFVEVGDLFASADARDALAPLNPLAQVPVLELDDEVLTESAAITLHLADLTRSDLLVPPPDAPERARFLRWLVFLVANVYPIFTYGDEPTRYVEDDDAARAFRERLDHRIEMLWTVVEAAAGAPWFLGERRSALDVYLAVMTRWRPRRAWFAQHAPHLHAIARRIDDDPAFTATWARNFPDAVPGD